MGRSDDQEQSRRNQQSEYDRKEHAAPDLILETAVVLDVLL